MISMIDRLEVAAGLAGSLVTYAASRGIDAAPIARASGLDPDKFGAMFDRIGLDRLCRFMEALAIISQDDQFGLKAGAIFDKGASGPFGYALIHAPTVRQALTFIGRNMHKVTDVSVCSLEEGPREVRFQWSYSPLILRRDQFSDMIAVLSLAHFHDMLGPDMDLARIELERPKPKNLMIYKELLCRNISFSAPVNAFILPTALMARANPRADPRLFAILARQLDDMRVTRPQASDPVTATRYLVLDTMDGAVPTLAEVASRLGMSERTLQRRLTEAGTGLQDIVDECRRELAEKLLSETNMTLAQIAYRLGFSAPSAFTRSAARWFGMSPSAFRRTVRK
jgi:AraC-type DNA-binding domain-containing proteins